MVLNMVVYYASQTKHDPYYLAIFFAKLIVLGAIIILPPKYIEKYQGMIIILFQANPYLHSFQL